MFQNLSDKDKKKNKKQADKTLKTMGISASVLMALLIYSTYKGSEALSGGNYIMGLGFIAVLIGLAFILQIKKVKIVK